MNTSVTNTKIIYHQVKPGLDCPDGIAAAWVVRKVYPDAEIIGACYQTEIPEVNTGDSLLIVDFSFPAQVLENWADMGCEVMVIDHHQTAMDHLSGLSDRVLKRFDLSECGATLTWKHFFPDKEIPAFLQYVKDRDLWNFDLPQSEEIFEAVGNIGRSFALFDVLELLSAEQLIGAFAPKRQRIAELAQSVRQVSINGISCLAVELQESESLLASDLCSYLYKLNPQENFVVAYYKSADGDYNLSFRSDKKGNNFDVSAIASSLGGGGHRNAAGAKVGKLPFGLIPVVVGRDLLGKYISKIPVSFSHGVLFSGDRYLCVDEAIALMDGDTLTALATIAPEGEQYNGIPSIVGVWVSPSHRRQGYGKKVLQAAVERCIERNLIPVQVDALVEPIKKIVASFDENLRRHIDLKDMCMPGFPVILD